MTESVDVLKNYIDLITTCRTIFPFLLAPRDIDAQYPAKGISLSREVGQRLRDNVFDYFRICWMRTFTGLRLRFVCISRTAELSLFEQSVFQT